MKAVKRLLALVLALVLLLTPMVSVGAAEADEANVLYTFELEEFLNTLPNSKIQYDYYKLITALQGLVNRDKPQLYFFSFDNGAPKNLGYDMDEFWFENITGDKHGYGELADGGDLADYKIVKVKSFWKLLNLFEGYYNGFVLWDEDVPSTANVASTIAGVENLLPVRYAVGTGDLYLELLNSGFKASDVKRDLCGLFSGEGYIPTLGSSVPGAKIEYTTTPSTLSQKTDPYIWAKLYYLDTGLTHPLHMTYSLDGRTQQSSTWNQAADASTAKKPELAVKIVSANIPTKMAPGEVRPISITFENTGTTTLQESTYDRLAINNGASSDYSIVKHFGLYTDANGTAKATGDANRLKLSAPFESGDTVTMTGYLKAPLTAGEYSLQFWFNRELHGKLSDTYTPTILVKSGLGLSEEDKYIPYLPPVVTEYADAEKDAAIVTSGIDASVEASKQATAQVVVKNIGSETWPAGSTYELAYTIGSASGKLPVAAATVSGETAVFDVPFTAPASGSMKIELQMYCGADKVGEAYIGSAEAESAGAGSYDAQIISTEYATTVDGGAKLQAVIKVKNTGSAAWTNAAGIALTEQSGKKHMSENGPDDDNDALVDAIGIEPGVTVEPGDTYLFLVDLHSHVVANGKKQWVEPGTAISLDLQMEADGAVFGNKAEVEYTVFEKCTTPTTEYANAADVKMTQNDISGVLLSAAMPTQMNVGELVPIRFTLMNNGTETWEPIAAGRRFLRMAFKSAQNGFAFITNKETGAGDVGDKNRIDIRKGVAVEPGDVYTYTAWLKAPAEAATYDLTIDGHEDGKGKWAGALKVYTIKVVDPANLSVESVSEEAFMLELEPQFDTQAADAISVSVPSAQPYTELSVTATAKNDTSAAWTAPTGVSDVLVNTTPTAAGVYMKYTAANPFNPTATNKTNPFVYYAPLKANTATGYSGSFDLKFTTPVVEGTYDLKLQVVSISGSTETVLVAETTEQFTAAAATPAATPASTTAVTDKSATYKVQFVSAKIPTKMNPGEEAFISLTYKNVGTTDIGMMSTVAANNNLANRGNIGLVAQSGTGGFDLKDYGFGLSFDGLKAAGNGMKGDYHKTGWPRLNMREGQPERTFTKNQQRVFTGKLVAPETPGTYTLSFAGVVDLKTLASDMTNFTVTVVDPNAKAIVTGAPKTAEPYTELTLTAKAKNETGAAWTVPSGVTAPVEAATVSGVYLKYEYNNPFNPTTTNKKNPFVYYAPLSAATAVGADGTFKFSLYTPVVEGKDELKTKIVSINGSTETVLVDEVIDEIDVKTATPKATAASTTAASNKSTTYKMEFVEAKIPATMKVGESAFISVTYKNTGAFMNIMSSSNPTQGQRASVGLCAQSGTGGFELLDYGFSFASGGEKHDTWALGYVKANQLHLREGQPSRNFDINETEVFTGVLTAPETPGTYTLSFAGFSGTETYASDMTNFTVVVEAENAGGEEETPSETKEVVFHASADVTTEDYDATIMSAVLPETVRPGEKIAVSFTVKNTGKTTFKSHLNAPNKNESLRIGFLTNTVVGYYKASDTLDANGYMAKKFFVLSDSSTESRNGAPWVGAANGEYSRMDMLSGKTVASGATYTYTGHLVCPTTPGTYTFEIVALADVAGAGSKAWWSDKETITIKVVDPNAEPEVENNVIFHESAEMTTEQYKAAIMGANVPLQVDPGEKFDVSFTVKNIGTSTFKSARNVAANNEACLRLAFFGAAEFHSTTRDTYATNGDKLDANGLMENKFFVLCSSTTTQRDDAPWEGAANREYNRLDLLTDKTLASGDVYHYTGSFVAPSKEGKYTLQIIALTETGSAGHRSAKETITITVGEPDAYRPEEEVYEKQAYDASIILANAAEVTIYDDGAEGTVKFAVKNTGENAWTATTEDSSEGYYLRLRIGGTPYYIPVGADDVEAGDVVELSLDYPAPEREREFSITAQVVYYDKDRGISTKFIGDAVTVMTAAGLDTDIRDGEIVSIECPAAMNEGTKDTVRIEVRNTGSMTWNDTNKVVLAEVSDKAYFSAPGTADDAAPVSALSIEPGVTVAPGESYVFIADLHTWTTFKDTLDYVRPSDDLQLELRLEAISGESVGLFGKSKSISVDVKDVVVVPETYSMLPEGTTAEDIEMSTANMDAVLVSTNIPEHMSPGQVVPMNITFMNTGTVAWYNDTSNPNRWYTQNAVRLRIPTNGAFGLYSNQSATASYTSGKDRCDLPASTKNDPIEQGEMHTFSCYLKAPEKSGTYVLEVYLHNERNSNELTGGFYEGEFCIEFTIQVGSESNVEETEIASSSIRYDVHGLMATAVGNSDYYIAHKAFFWDLAMDETIAPLDDRSQPVGTDVKVLRELLNSQRKRAQAYEEGKDPWNKVPGVGEGMGIFQVGGFLPWFLKYCKESDPQSKQSAAYFEWMQMMHVSEYGGGCDADAYGTITISNCSVFSKLKNNVKKYSANVTQAQPDFDPMVGDPTVKYDPEKTYILWHMGDWDGSSWTASILPGLWETDPRRGEIPVGWAVAAGNSLRIPQLFNWQYNNATPNDYFIAGDNGTNYYDPNMNSRPHTEITGVTKEMGLEILDDFIAYNQYFNDIFSIGVTGLLHTAGSGPSDDTVRAAFQKISPYGVGVTQEGANTKLEDIGIFVGEDGTKTPYIPSYVFTTTSDGTLKSSVDSLASNLLTRIKYGRQFQVLRTVKVKVTSLCEIMEAMEAKNPGVDQMYEVVDPYTFFRLARESNGGFASRGTASYDLVSGTAKIDGEISAGEWDKAKEMHVSPMSAEISKHGKNWAPTTLATEEDLNTKFRVMWDNNYLYVLENRQDDGHIGTSKTNGIDWTADTGAVYISLDGLEAGSSYFTGDYAVIFNLDTAGKTNVWIRAGGEGGVKTERQLNANEYVAVARLGNGGNYVYEIAIPWSTLGGMKPAVGKQVGLTMLAIDGDDGSVGGGRQIMWAGNGDDQTTWAKATVKN